MAEPSERELALFSAARHLPTAERAAYLEGACANDAGMRQRVEELLRVSDEVGPFLQDPAPGVQLSADAFANALTWRDPAPAPAEKVGDRIGRYKLLQQIGEGGCGIVYMAEQEEPVRRRVALKVIKLGMDTKQVIARFEAERQALALMDHPNIAKVLDAGATATGRPYFVMELVKGIKITAYCDQGNLSTRERLNLFIQVCQAVQHAHQKGVIHRDIKPSNILVTSRDGVPVPKVIDFGIAKATTDQPLTDKTLFTAFEQFMGTPAYMSPEQAEMSELGIDTRSDIYSLGVLLYELLTGRTPFDAKELLGAGLEAMRRTIREQEPARPSTRLSTLIEGELSTVAKHHQTDAPKLIHLLRGDLDWIVMKALEKDRGRRYETANGLASDVQRYLADEAVVARPPSTLYRFEKVVRRNKLAFGAMAGITMALVLGIAVSGWQAVRATRAEREQNRLRENAEKGQHVEASLRQQAEAAEKIAQTEARRAEAAAKELTTTLSSSDFAQAVRLIAEDDASDALAFLARSLSLNPTNEAALTRLVTCLTYHSWVPPALILKHGGEVRSAHFSPDGTRVLTASTIKTARMWDARTGQPLMKPMKHDAPLLSAEFSPDGNRILTGSVDGTDRVWDAQSGQPLTEPMQCSNFVSAHFSPDGKRIVTASGGARVWDAATGLPLTNPIQQGSWMNSAVFSPDGTRIATASADRTARVWDAQTGLPIIDPVKHGGEVESVQFSSDGTRFVTASDDGSARVWDARTGQPIAQPLKHGDRVLMAAFSPDGKRIITASSDRAAHLWDAQTGLPLAEPMKHSRGVVRAEFSKDGRRVLTASLDQTARVWDAQTGQPVTEPMKHGHGLVSAEFSPEGNRVVTVSQSLHARVWNVQSRDALTEPMNYQDGDVMATSAEFSPNGKWIATLSIDKTARLWDSQTGQPLSAPLKQSTNVMLGLLSPDARRMVAAYADNTARLWDLQTGMPLGAALRHDTNVLSAQFSPDGKRILTITLSGKIRVWDAQTGEPVTKPFEGGTNYVSAQFDPMGSRIVTAAEYGRIWDAQTGQPLAGPITHGKYITCAQFTPDGSAIFTAADNTGRLWDVKTGQPLMAAFKLGAVVIRARFSPDGRRVVTISQDGPARVWDARTGQPLTEPLKHGKTVSTAEFSSNGKWILTAAFDGTARVWDAETGQPLTDLFRHGNWVLSAQFSPDCKRIVTGSAGGTARVWDIVPASTKFPDWLLPLTEIVAGQVLNKKGVLEPSQLAGAKVLDQIREQLNEQPDDDDWVVWGRWFLADPAMRTISPFSKVTVPQYIENRINENTAASLDEAERLAIGNPELLRRLSEARKTLKQAR